MVSLRSCFYKPASSADRACFCSERFVPTLFRVKLLPMIDRSDMFWKPPTIADIEAMADKALATIPAVLLKQVGDILIRVQDFPDADTEIEMDLETPFDLLGLYRGADMLARRTSMIPTDISLIFLYRRPILDYWCESAEDLPHLVRHVLLHEIGHHFGFSDEDMEAIEAGKPVG